LQRPALGATAHAARQESVEGPQVRIVTRWGKAILFGFFMWLIPFVVAVAVFALHESSRPLFESIMAVTVTASAVVLAVSYLRTVRCNSTREGIGIGVLWLLMCVLIDAPLMLLGGPMQMTVGAYMADIGVTYLIIPVVTVGLALAQSRATG